MKTTHQGDFSNRYARARHLHEEAGTTPTPSAIKPHGEHSQAGATEKTQQQPHNGPGHDREF